MTPVTLARPIGAEAPLQERIEAPKPNQDVVTLMAQTTDMFTRVAEGTYTGIVNPIDSVLPATQLGEKMSLKGGGTLQVDSLAAKFQDVPKDNKNGLTAATTAALCCPEKVCIVTGKCSQTADTGEESEIKRPELTPDQEAKLMKVADAFSRRINAVNAARERGEDLTKFDVKKDEEKSNQSTEPVQSEKPKPKPKIPVHILNRTANSAPTAEDQADIAKLQSDYSSKPTVETAHVTPSQPTVTESPVTVAFEPPSQPAVEHPPLSPQKLAQPSNPAPETVSKPSLQKPLETPQAAPTVERNDKSPVVTESPRPVQYNQDVQGTVPTSKIEQPQVQPQIKTITVTESAPVRVPIMKQVLKEPSAAIPQKSVDSTPPPKAVQKNRATEPVPFPQKTADQVPDVHKPKTDLQPVQFTEPTDNPNLVRTKPVEAVTEVPPIKTTESADKTFYKNEKGETIESEDSSEFPQAPTIESNDSDDTVAMESSFVAPDEENIQEKQTEVVIQTSPQTTEVSSEEETPTEQLSNDTPPVNTTTVKSGFVPPVIETPQEIVTEVQAAPPSTEFAEIPDQTIDKPIDVTEDNFDFVAPANDIEPSQPVVDQEIRVEVPDITLENSFVKKTVFSFEEKSSETKPSIISKEIKPVEDSHITDFIPLAEVTENVIELIAESEETHQIEQNSPTIIVSNKEIKVRTQVEKIIEKTEQQTVVHPLKKVQLMYLLSLSTEITKFVKNISSRPKEITELTNLVEIKTVIEVTPEELKNDTFSKHTFNPQLIMIYVLQVLAFWANSQVFVSKKKDKKETTSISQLSQTSAVV